MQKFISISLKTETDSVCAEIKSIVDSIFSKPSTPEQVKSVICHLRKLAIVAELRAAELQSSLDK